MIPRAQIVATGSYVPEAKIKNDDLTQFPRNAIPLIEEKTGVRERRHAGPNQCTSDLAVIAAARCLERAPLDAAALDALILATSSPDRIQPATATRVQTLIGAHNAFAFDINSVCTGAVYAISLADALIRSGNVRSVLVVAAEIYSRFLNPKDFTTYPYFGDGAGAVLLCSAHEGSAGIIETLLGSDGSGADVIQVPAGGTMLPYNQMSQSTDAYFKMRGREVYEFAVEKGSSTITELMERAGLGPNAVSWVVSHQANINIIKTIASKCGIPADRFVVNLDRYGNTAAASALIALDELLTSGRAVPNDRIIMVAFGGGLSWGGALLTI